MAYSTQYEAAARAAGWIDDGSVFRHPETNEMFGPASVDWCKLCAAAGVEIDHDALLRRFSNTAQEFPDFDLASLPEIPESWKDASWHNETCPGFNPFGTVYVFVDYPNAADREFPECEERFSVIDHAGGVVSHYHGNDWDAVLEMVESLQPEEPENLLRDSLGAIDALLTQCYQMQGMFDDSDGTIAEAVESAEEMAERLRKALKVGTDAKG